MNIHFKVAATELNKALAIVKLVTPRPFDRTGSSGYLFIIRGQEGLVYSSNASYVARASFPLSEVEGEGAFIYPAAHVDAFGFFEGKDIVFDVTQEGDAIHVKYDPGPGLGAGGDRISFDAKFMVTCDRELEASKNPCEFSAAALREALSMSKGFQLTDTKGEDDARKVIQIFDKNYETDEIKDGSPTGNKTRPYERGDGNLYVANGVQAFYLECSDFRGKSLSIHQQHVSLLQSFLSKCKGNVRVTTGTNMSFAKDDQGRVLGWGHTTKQHGRYAYYSLTSDHMVFLLDRDDVLKALSYVRSEMDEKGRIKFVYDDASETIQFQTAGEGKTFSSWRIPVKLNPEGSKKRKSFVANSQVDHLRMILDGVKSPEAQLRVHLIDPSDKRPKGGAFFRTFDEFVLDREGRVIGGSGVTEENLPEGAVLCKATRFTPSFD